MEQKEILDVLSCLSPSGVTCGKVRTGGPHDGGYVMADALTTNEICYSIGVGPQVSWDHDMAARGMTIHQYDHTVEQAPTSDPRFHFNKIGLAAYSDDADIITLQSMLERNGHTNTAGMLLKIDVEGAEWDFLDHLVPGILSKFDQIVMEIHGLEYMSDRPFRDRARRGLRKLTNSHRCIHVHANNYASFSVIENIPIPGCIEVTLALKSKFQFIETFEVFPGPLDGPCNPGFPDIYLGSFQFRPF